MKKIILTSVLLLSASLAQADLYESRQADGTRNFSDRAATNTGVQRLDTKITHPLEAGELPGVWQANSANGHKTELTLRSNGSFVFDQANDSTLHRLYMCGTWQGSDDALALVVMAQKRQLESGDIEQADGDHRQQAAILSAQRDRMILLINGEKLVFDRAG